MSRHTRAYIALVYICIAWGTTYLAIRVGVLHFPAFLFAAIRQLISAVIIIAVALMVNKRTDLSKSNLLHQAFVGFLLITVGNGLVSWGEKHIPSGIAALICSVMPICAVMINLIVSKREKINGHILAGLVVGFGGVALIFKDEVSDLTNKNYVIGIIATFIATTSWAAGSVFNKKRISLVNPVFNAGLQLLFGGIFLLIVSPFADDYRNMNIMHPGVLSSLIYLVIFGSVLAYTAYMYALKELPVGIVALYAYINPLVAVILGYLVLSEPLTWFTAMAFLSIVSGVYLVNHGYRKQHREAKTR